MIGRLIDIAGVREVRILFLWQQTTAPNSEGARAAEGGRGGGGSAWTGMSIHRNPFEWDNISTW